MTDDKTLPKAKRKRLQIVNAPELSVRAQIIKLADKISNLRAILASPPADWSAERKREYFDWAKRVVDGLTEPNQVLKTEFDPALETPALEVHQYTPHILQCHRTLAVKYPLLPNYKGCSIEQKAQ